MAILASACGDDDDDIAIPSDGTAAPSPAAQADRDAADLREALTAAGIIVVEDPGSAPPPGGMQLWSFQVENMGREYERGGGYVGAELDEMMGSPGGMPFSYLLAGWITSGVSPASDDARDLMGEAEWGNAPAVVFPTGVLALFVADALDASGATEANAAPLVQLASYGGSVCETVAGWVKSALDFIFDGLKVEEPGDGFLGWLGTVWNAALDLARGAVESLIETLTAPVVDLITSALAVVGTLTMIASLLTPWGLEVIPSQATTRVAIGNEPDIRESFEARVDTNIDFEWPGEIEGCARIADIELPDPSSARGAAIQWTTFEVPPLATAQIPDMGTVTSSDQFVGSSNTARLRWETGRQETDEGETKVGSFAVSAVVTSDEALKLRKMIEGLISGRIPSEVPFASDIENYFKELTAPVLDKLVEFAQVRGDASMRVLYHFDGGGESEATTTTTTEPEDAGAGGFVLLEQRHRFRVQAKTRDLGLTNPIDLVDTVEVESFDADPTRQSTETLDVGEPLPIEPLGFDGYALELAVGTDRATASALGDFRVTNTGGTIEMRGEYERSLSGSAPQLGDSFTSGEDALSVAIVSTGVLFTITDAPREVFIGWSCSLRPALEILEDRQTAATIFDERFDDECAGFFEGTLQPGVVYQFVVSLGLFDDRYTSEGKVYGNSGEVLSEDTSYNLTEIASFSFILYP